MDGRNEPSVIPGIRHREAMPRFLTDEPFLDPLPRSRSVPGPWVRQPDVVGPAGSGNGPGTTARCHTLRPDGRGAGGPGSSRPGNGRWKAAVVTPPAGRRA